MPYWDDWGIGGLLYNYHTVGLSFEELTQDINQHRQVFGKLMSIGLFEMNQQQWDPFVLMIANSITWTASGLFLISIAIKHHHEINPTPIIFLILVLWLYPISLVNAVWGVQSHVYFMVLFAILGCWFAGEPPFSAKWILGIFCVFAGGLTLAGGSFIGVSVATVYLLLTIFDKPRRNQHLWTCLFAALGGALGLTLIAIQPGTSAFMANLESFESFLTFAKSMSWPVRTQIWPFFIFLIPIITLVFYVIKDKRSESRLIPFMLSLYGFIFITTIAIAAARSSNGAGPARRYADFLALAFVASSFALVFIQQKKYRLPRLANHSLIVLWVFASILAIPYRMETTFFTIEDRNTTVPYQEQYVRQYINTYDSKKLLGKRPRHVPFPRPESLAKYLIDFEEADILPYSLQKPPELTYNPEQSLNEWKESAFITNGFHLPVKNISTDHGWDGELVMGSFYEPRGGVKITGNYESNTFEIKRPYAMIPIIGYLGYSGTQLKLVNVISGDEIIIEPSIKSSELVEDWREVLVKVKRGYYKLVAEDSSETLWFGFAAPRSVGRLSYLGQKILDMGQIIWLSGVGLLCLINRKKIIYLIQNKTV